MSDVLIVGGGPAALSCAINAASEGLSVRLLDNGTSLGGQAKESHAIENYPGFPERITGVDLMTSLVRQAKKFGVNFTCPVSAQKLIQMHNPSTWKIVTDEFDEYAGKTVVLAMGLQYRRLSAEGISEQIGKHIFYGMPRVPQGRKGPSEFIIVGGANSAGQAALKLAERSSNRITMVVRRNLESGMSKYLIDRINSKGNIEVLNECEVKAVNSLRVELGYGEQNIVRTYEQMFIFIGAQPKTGWLPEEMLTTKKFVKSNPCFEACSGEPRGCYPGLYVIGDVRDSSVKRIAAAVGEGSGVVPYIHQYLSTL